MCTLSPTKDDDGVDYDEPEHAWGGSANCVDQGLCAGEEAVDGQELDQSEWKEEAAHGHEVAVDLLQRDDDSEILEEVVLGQIDIKFRLEKYLHIFGHHNRKQETQIDELQKVGDSADGQ